MCKNVYKMLKSAKILDRQRYAIRNGGGGGMGVGGGYIIKEPKKVIMSLCSVILLFRL